MVRSTEKLWILFQILSTLSLIKFFHLPNIAPSLESRSEHSMIHVVQATWLHVPRLPSLFPSLAYLACYDLFTNCSRNARFTPRREYSSRKKFSLFHLALYIFHFARTIFFVHRYSAESPHLHQVSSSIHFSSLSLFLSQRSGASILCYSSEWAVTAVDNVWLWAVERSTSRDVF